MTRIRDTQQGGGTQSLTRWCAPTVLDKGKMMEEKLVTVAVFGAPYEAEMAKGELEANGIPAFVLDQFTIGANPLYSNALGGIKLQVPASYAEDAQRIISIQVPQEEADPIKPEPNPKKTIAQTFVWLYLALAAAGTAFVVYLYTAGWSLQTMPKY